MHQACLSSLMTFLKLAELLVLREKSVIEIIKNNYEKYYKNSVFADAFCLLKR